VIVTGDYLMALTIISSFVGYVGQDLIDEEYVWSEGSR
jgi:hypothetical protein